MRQLNDFNSESILGPGTDLVISLVAVLVVLMSISMAKFQNLEKELEKVGDIEALKERNVLLSNVREYQYKIIQEIAASYDSEATTKDSLTFDIIIYKGTKLQDTISIRNDVSLQRFSFGEKILFSKNSSVLQRNGKKVIYEVGNIFKNKLKYIEEIQIQGHADNQGTKAYNLSLASKRSIAVFEHLRKKVGINPINYLMSISSYGSYKPFNRKVTDAKYTVGKLEKANETKELSDKNRRIEIVLNYRGDFIAK